MVDIPINGTVRAAANVTIKGETAKNYCLLVMYGTYDATNNVFNYTPDGASYLGCLTTAVSASGIVNLDTELRAEVTPTGTMDAMIVICDSVDAAGFPVGVYDSYIADDKVRFYLEYGATITAVSFSSI